MFNQRPNTPPHLSSSHSPQLQSRQQPFMSRPPSPPTPAPSPRPVLARDVEVDPVSQSSSTKEIFIQQQSQHQSPENLFSMACQKFAQLNNAERQQFLAFLLEHCDTQQLVFVNNFIAPRLKRDFLRELPTEIALHILSFIDEPKTLARASCVSKTWWSLLNHESTWRLLCSKHKYVRLSPNSLSNSSLSSISNIPFFNRQGSSSNSSSVSGYPLRSPTWSPYSATFEGDMDIDPKATIDHKSMTSESTFSYRNHFKYRFLVDQNWRHGGRHMITKLPSLTLDEDEMDEDRDIGLDVQQRLQAGVEATAVQDPYHLQNHIQPQPLQQQQQPHLHHNHAPHQGGLNMLPGGVVTSLQINRKYIVVGLDSSEIHVFGPKGSLVRTLNGHENGVWALHLVDDTLVSGGCDRNIRIWDVSTGLCKHKLRGHTSTIRCIKMQNKRYAVSGSRDTTLRIWDIENGKLQHLLLGHQSSVRCLEICGDVIVSGSYDYTARVWSLSTGRCLQVLHGHQSQIYTIGFDGKRVVTGSLDMTVRVWNPHTGECIGVLSGHTQLVGQLQLSEPYLVTGGSDGALRMWSIEGNECLHRLAAHDNSVTCLQFDERRIVSGGSDGKVKLWDIETGRLIRELTEPSGAVWRLAFEETRCVVLLQRGGGTYMEVIDFEP